MKQIKSLALLTLLGFALGPVTAAYAGPGDCKHGHGFGHMEERDPGGHFMRLSAELELTDEQKTQMKSLREERKAQRGDRDTLRKAHRELHELVTAKTIDEAAIRAKALEVAYVQADRAVEHARFIQRFRDILTPEQLEKFDEIKAEHRGGMKRKWHRHAHQNQPAE